jgi:serine/threonine protein kinase
LYARVLKVVILYYDVQGYIAPEHIDKGEISFMSDIYSLGIIIRKLLKGSNNLSDFEEV